MTTREQIQALRDAYGDPDYGRGVLRARILADLTALLAEPPCMWTPDEDGAYHTSCGEAYQFIDGGPAENSQRFCGYCGRPLQVGADRTHGGLRT